MSTFVALTRIYNDLGFAVALLLDLGHCGTSGSPIRIVGAVVLLLLYW